MSLSDTQPPRKIKITVDGIDMDVLPGKTILQVLLASGIHVPHLCYDARLMEQIGQCGLCVVSLDGSDRFVKSCQTPVHDGMKIITDNPELKAYRRLRLEQILSMHNADCVAPCETTCPAHIDIQAYLRQVAAGDFQGAIRIIKEHNPLPLCTGRVCPHSCETACRRNLADEPIAINHIKRFVADYDLKSGAPYAPQPAASTEKRIAIVGAGPSGLAAAYYSALRGHSVTMFDQQPLPGGMMRYGIPRYRLPLTALDAEIQTILNLGVTFIGNRRLGVQLRLEHLTQTYDAVYLSVGSWQATSMRLDGESASNVWTGIGYLEQVAKGISTPLGDEVAVIGGGNTAVDCARTALRQGAKHVRLIYRRTRHEMPAMAYEVEEAIREGVEMIFLAAPIQLEIPPDGSNRVARILCQRMELGEPDRSGRQRPIPIEGSEFTIETTAVIGAIGQQTNTSYLYNDMPVKLNRWGDVEIAGRTMQTSIPGVFAGGDCVTGPATVVQAVAAGRRAAEAIDEFLDGGTVTESPEDYSCSRGTLEDLPRYEFERIARLPRAKMPHLSFDERAGGFAEVELGITAEQAITEAQRCLRCGCTERYSCVLRNEATRCGISHKPPLSELRYAPIVRDHPFITRDHNKCIACGLCVAACNEIAGCGVLGMYLKNGRFCVGTKSGRPLEQSECVSCGQCVNACPCGALEYRRECDAVFAALHRPETMVIGFVAPAVRSVIASYFGLSHEKTGPFLAGLLKKMGFDKVFDFVFGADLTVVEETNEFLRRLDAKSRLPHFTSCCPGWVNYVERRHPELIPNLSSCKSPQQMMGATVKNHYLPWAGIDPARQDVFVVSVVPCLAKKYEAARPEFAPGGVRDVDAVLTTTELIEMVKSTQLDVSSVALSEFDEPYKHVSGAGVLFGVSGGVAEASLRMAYEKLNGQDGPARLEFAEVRGLDSVKTACLEVGGRSLRLAVVSGLKNVEPFLQKLREGEDIGFDLIEVMACPGGCIAGAGHPAPERSVDLAARQDVLTRIDRSTPLRKPQDNPDILRLYDEFYESPGSAVCKRLLHTQYTVRDTRGVDDVMLREESAYRTRDIRVCVAEKCFEKGSFALLEALQQKIRELRMDYFVTARPQAFHGHSETEGIYIQLDGQRVEAESLQDLDAFVKSLAD